MWLRSSPELCVGAAGEIDHLGHRPLELGATALILVHNHPSGDPTPSRDDIAMTRTVAEALNAVNVALHDHVIIGRQGHASFRSLGLL